MTGNGAIMKTPFEFQRQRLRLGLTVPQLAKLVGVAPRAVEAWEQNPEVTSARKPNPTVCRVLDWIEAGKLKL